MKEKHIETAIVILNWNGEKHLKTFLPSVVKYSTYENTEIVVADNGSEDNSVEFLKKNYPAIRLIPFDKNYGFAEGYNRALALVDADFYVLLNSDVELSPDWLKFPIEMLKENEDIAAVAPKILSYTNKEKFEYAGAAGGYIDKYGYPFCRGRLLDITEIDKKQYDDTTEIFWASGAALFIKAKIFHEVGGLDGDFFAHMEEIDLCWRIKHAGKKIMYCPKSVVYHLGGGALPQTSPFKLYLNYRNNLKMLYKNLPSNKLFLTLLSRLFLDGCSAIVYLASLKLSYFVAVFKAHFSFYKNIKYDRKKRQNFSAKYELKNHPEIFKKSIIWNYFVKKKKYFSQLNFKT